MGQSPAGVMGQWRLCHALVTKPVHGWHLASFQGPSSATSQLNPVARGQDRDGWWCRGGSCLQPLADQPRGRHGQDWVTRNHNVGASTQHSLPQEGAEKVQDKPSPVLASPLQPERPGTSLPVSPAPQDSGKANLVGTPPAQQDTTTGRPGGAAPREEQAEPLLHCPCSSSPAAEEGNNGVMEVRIRPE